MSSRARVWANVDVDEHNQDSNPGTSRDKRDQQIPDNFRNYPNKDLDRTQYYTECDSFAADNRLIWGPLSSFPQRYFR